MAMMKFKTTWLPNLSTMRDLGCLNHWFELVIAFLEFLKNP